MPICTSCTTRTPYLYTVYESANNLRLKQCVCLPAHRSSRSSPLTQQQDHCQAFADPYVEHDSLTLFIDLVLLKRGVYRHLLYNRATKPNKASESTSVVPGIKEFEAEEPDPGNKLVCRTPHCDCDYRLTNSLVSCSSRHFPRSASCSVGCMCVSSSLQGSSKLILR